MKKTMTIAMASLLLAGTVASAHVASTTGDMRTPLGSATPTQTSGTSAVYKQAVIAAQDEAIAVIAGKNDVSEIFAKGAQAASQLLNVQFESNREAAIAILSISNN